MIVTTPGIDFIFSHFARLSIPPLALALAVRSLVSFYNGTLPTWLLISISTIGIPLVPFLRILSKRIYDKRQARKLGTRLAPEVTGKRIGNFDILMRMREAFDTGYPADGLVEHEAKGPVMNLRMMWEDTVFTTSPENIKRVLATDFGNHVKGERFHHSMFSVLGSGVFNSDGDMWKFHRSMTRPFFTRDRISDFDLFDAHSSVAIAQIKQRMQVGYPIDFQDLMSRFTLDSAASFLFGASLHSLTAGLPYPHNASPPYNIPLSYASSQAGQANAFARAFLEAQEVLSSRERYGWLWPLTEIAGDKSAEPMRVVREYLDPIVREAVEKRKLHLEGEKARPGDGIIPLSSTVGRKADEVGEGETLIDHLVGLTSDSVVVRDETINIMIAGRDTTAATLTFVIYFLAMYPHVLSRLRDEVLEKVGPSRRPDYGDIRDMKYLRAVINETMRLFPIVPFNVRESIKAAVWPSPDPDKVPIYIPGGTKIVYSVFLMHRRKDLWGPDAEEFDPDRFLDERLQMYLLKNSFIFLPFNAGPRICLGQQFAYNEISFMVIRLLQQFSEIELDLEACPVESRPRAEWKEGVGRKRIERVYPKMHLTMFASGGLWVRMKEADI